MYCYMPSAVAVPVLVPNVISVVIPDSPPPSYEEALLFFEQQNRRMLPRLCRAEISKFDKCAVSWKCGNKTFSCRISDDLICCENFGLSVYVNGKILDYAKDSGILQNAITRMHAEPFLHKIIQNDLTGSEDSDRFFKSVTVAFSLHEEDFSSPIVEVVVFNEHNGFYSHSYWIAFDGQVVENKVL